MEHYGLPSHHVNMATLDLYVAFPLFRTSFMGLTLDISIRYQSGLRHRGLFGDGWRCSYESHIRSASNSTQVILEKSTGQVLCFAKKPHLDFSSIQYDILQPMGAHREILYEYADCLLYEDRGANLFLKYQKNNASDAFPLWQILDRSGNALTLQYGPTGNISSLSDPFGRTILFRCNPSGLCEGLLLPDGRETTFAYDANGQLCEVRNFCGTPTRLQYDTLRRLEAIVVGNKQYTTSFSYDRTGHHDTIRSVKDRNGQTTQYALIRTNPETVKVTDPLGRSRHYVSRSGLTEQIIGPDGATVAIHFENGLPTVVTDKNGNRQLMAYDDRGNLVRRTDAEGGAEFFTYDSHNNLASHTDMLGRVTRLSYDPRGNLIAMIRPDGV